MTSPHLIAEIEKLNRLKAERRGLEIIEDEALADIQYCNERRPALDELIRTQELYVEDLKGKSAMARSDSLWSLKRLREWTNTL